MGHFAILLLLAAATPTKPELTLRASPRLSLVNLGIGCSPVLLTAEIRGPETEAWYCPRVEWQWPNGTVSATESDCPPFETRNTCFPARGNECALDWHWEDGSFVVDNNPCDCTVPGFPRRWTRNICVPANPVEGEAWSVSVRLSRDGRTIARDTVRFTVR